MISQLDNSRYARSILSNSARRQVLWNVLEPGDPYDIKKSMIAKLPGDKKKFMGDHLEIVCLLQAAEIERLCQFLDDYKLKFRQIERSVLDRHSYEVQIKELTQRLADEQSLRSESAKLKEFIKRQGNEIEILQKNSRDNRQTDDSYKNMYEKSLERVNQLLIENKDIRMANQDFRLQLQTSAVRMEAFDKAKNREIEDLKLSFAQHSKESYEGNLNALRQKYEAEIKRYEYDLKRQKEAIEAKNVEITQIYRRSQEMAMLINQLKGKGDQHYELERQIVQYENKFVIFGHEIERLNISLRDHIGKLEQADLKRRELERRLEKNEFEARESEGKARSAANEITHLKQLLKRHENSNRKVEESQQFISQYQAKISELTREWELLNNKLRLELENNKNLREEVSRLSYENSRVKLLEKENSELKEGGIELNLLRRKIAETDNQVVIFHQEIDRLSALHKLKDAETQKYRALAFENEALRAKIKENEYSLRSHYESEINRIKNESEVRYENLKRSQGSEYQSKAQIFENERDRLKDMLREKSEEAERQRVKIYEMEALINRSEVESTVKIKNYEVGIATLRRQNEQLYSKLKQLTDSERRLFELQGKFTQYEHQLQRLTSVLKVREQEVITLRNKLRQTQGQTVKLQTDVSRKLAGYQQNINQVRSENEELKRRLKDLLNQSNHKLMEASQEIERLGANLHSKQEERNKLEVIVRQLAQETELLKQNLQRANAENEELRKRLVQAENKIASLVNDSSSTIRTVAAENDTLKRQLLEMKTAITAYEAEVTKRITIYEQTINGSGSQNDQMRKRIFEYESKLSMLSQELQRLHQKMRAKTDQTSTLQTNYKTLGMEYENLKKYFKEYESSVTNKLEGEVVRKYSTYEQNIQGLGRQNEELKRIIAEYELKITRLTQDNEKFSHTLKQAAQDNEQLRRQINQTQSQIGSFQLDVKKTLTTYQSNLQTLTLQRDQLTRKLTEIQLILKQRTEQLRLVAKQNENIKRQFKEYEFSVSQKLQGDVARKYALYEQTIAKLNQQNDELRRKIQELGGDMARKLAQAENKVATLTQEFERTKTKLNSALQENEGLKKKLEDYNLSIANYEAEVHRRMTATDQKHAGLIKQNEDLRRKIQELSDVTRKLAECESRVAVLSQELERTTNNFNRLTQQHENLKKQLTDRMNSVNNYETEVSKRVNVYEQNINFLQKENAEHKRKVGEYEQRLLGLSEELQRMNAAYKLKVEEANVWQSNHKVIINENENYKRKFSIIKAVVLE